MNEEILLMLVHILIAAGIAFQLWVFLHAFMG